MMKRWGIIVAVALLLVACGQPKQKVVVESDLPPVDFVVNPADGIYKFGVEGSQAIEVMGTSMENFFRYKWRASNWKVEDDSTRSADVRFTDVQATERRGQTAAPEPIASYDRLENFSTRYRLDREGFKPVSEPARDQEFMQAFSVLGQGLSSFDFETPEAPMRPGESWTVSMDPGELGPMSVAALDSTIHLTYVDNIKYERSQCARVKVKVKIPLDGTMEQGPAKSHITGSIESEATALYDLEKRFYVLVKQSSIMKITGQDFDADGKALGGEKSFAQNGFFEITYLGR
ncbi:hypothetical protein H8E52_12685 [bacterium]|nr:hypothetical protein [bacterium]